MKVGDSRPVSATRSVGRKTRAADQTAAPKRAAVEDATSILGIPEAELTPKVRAAIMQLMHEVERMRQDLEQSTQRITYLEQLADQDTLVPVINRRAFVRELSRIVSFVERYRAPSSIIFFDVDDLKGINDTMGHAAGDAALTHIGKILVESVRESDIVGRLGGDEFGVILAQADEKRAAEKAASLAAEIAAKPLVWQGKSIKLSVAVGAHTISGDEDPSTALHAADRAMYTQKHENGKS